MNEAKRKNILFAVVAAVIAVVFFFAGFGTGFGVGKGAVDAPDAGAGAAEMNGGMQLSSDDTEMDKGVSLTTVKLAREAYDEYGIMPIAETAYTVTATVSGEGLSEEQRKVTWGEAVFKDPASEWATGKTVSDYVKTSVNDNQITVQCLQAFGEQIIIKCSSSFNPSISKDLKVDYKETIISYNLRVDFASRVNSAFVFQSDKANKVSFHFIPEEFSETKFTLVPVFSPASTIAADVVNYKFTFGMNERFFNGLKQSGLGEYLDDSYKTSFGEFIGFGSDLTLSSVKKTSVTSRGFLTYSSLTNLFNPAVYFKPAQIDEAQQYCLDAWGAGSAFLDLYVTVGDAEPVKMAEISIIPDTYRDWLTAQVDISGIEFDEPYSDGVIFNQE